MSRRTMRRKPESRAGAVEARSTIRDEVRLKLERDIVVGDFGGMGVIILA